MQLDIISNYTKFARPLIFALVLILHAAVIFLFNFTDNEEDAETIDFREAEVFKLVDIQEYVQPPVQQKEAVTVANQPKAAEKIVETDKEVNEEIEYLPQHKISSIPVIPTREVLSRIVYPPMALKQGIEAVVYLELFIDSGGTIRKIKVLKDPGHGFAQAAVNALQGLSCIPANVNGKNCAVKYRYPVKFTLN
ncbi:MAG: energy transducer TonB [Treponema sp.]|jgi:protein TonB|nr:energy transducer TonB [Treponema sp.]